MSKSILCVAFAGAALGMGGGARAPETHPGVRLEHHSWIEAERLLRPDTVVVIPLGAALKEHGPHLKLRNDLTLAEYLTDLVAATAPVVITPPLNYHFYPGFLEYPGSTSLTLDTARDYTVQVARSLARYGPRRFYVLNTGISTSAALAPAAAALATEGILLRFTDLGGVVDRLAAPIRQQERGSHADEIETSMMVYIDPAGVDMRRAVKDMAPPSTPVRLNRQPGGRGMHSPSGIWGDPTLATREKGRVVVEGLVSAILTDIEALRSTAPPASGPTPVQTGARRAPSGGPGPDGRGGCLPGVERDLKAIEAAFNAHWNNRDAIAFGALWSEEGDLVHGDGSTERGRRTITQNRFAQFRTREYRDARHSLAFGNIRCVNASVAVVDSKWELRDVTDADGKTLPRAEGFSTLVLQRGGNRWLIEAYRYNTKPGTQASPALLKRPGYPDKR